MNRPRPGVRLRIFDREFDVHAPDPPPGETLGDAESFGPRLALHIEPGLAVLSDRLYDQRVLVPMADGISHPGGLRIVGQRPPVREDLAVNGAGFVQQYRQVLRLDQLEAVRNVVFFGNARGQAGYARVVPAV